MKALWCVMLLILCPMALGQQPTENCAVLVLTPSSAAVFCPQNTAPDPSAMLDLPESNTYHSLCSFDLVEVLLGVTVIDGPGPDLQVEEVNSNTNEPYAVDVSPDGANWFPIPGPLSGGAWAGDAAIDIAGSGTPTVIAVRITDLSGVSTGNTPGADFDAIVCINYQHPQFNGVTRPYADVLVSYDPAGVPVTYGDGTRALGPPDAYRSETWAGVTNTGFNATWHNFVSLPQGATLVASFTSTSIVDGIGADLIVHEYFSPEGNQFTVEVSDDGFHWFPATLLGSVTPMHGTGAIATNNIQAYDLAGSGLTFADYVRIVSISTATTGATPGAELDSIEAVNFVSRPRNLVVSAPIANGALGTLDLIAPLHIGSTAITLASFGPPTVPGGGLPLGSGVEYRLSLVDPLVTFILSDPLAPLFFSGTVAILPGSGVHTIGLTLPAAPGLVGTPIWWQSGLIQGGSVAGVSNIVETVIQ